MQEYQHNESPDELASIGWERMKDLLDEHKPVRKEVPVFMMSKRLVFVAACLFLFLSAGVTYLLVIQRKLPAKAMSVAMPMQQHENSRAASRDNSRQSTRIGVAEKNIRTANSSDITNAVVRNEFGKVRIEPDTHIKSSENISEIGTTATTLARPVRCITYNYQMQDSHLISDAQSDPDRRKTDVGFKRDSFKRKPRLFIGGGINLSGNSGMSFNQITAHPALQLELPITSRLSIQTGISFFSSLHLKKQNAVQKEFVNNLVDDIFYKVYTTDVVKLNYVDLPVTINYRLAPGFSVGSGIQVSRLYKSKVSEKKETYDYGNRLTASSQNTFVTSAANFGAFPKQVSLNNWDARAVTELGWQKNRIKISAKYLFGLTDAIKILQPDGTKKEYRNSYIGVDVLYLLSPGK